ncbi:hypothetical protein ACFU3J_20140 [Streptomyces sp. NPDC057411]|uniref:hypothetical protein n=1 Tax=unclassified Streptomyces TaxID=2593676 RepID=UPI003641E926
MEEPTTRREAVASPEEVRARLREAAHAHAPDRARMLARVERGTTAEPGARRGPARPSVRAVRPVLRAAGAALAVAAVLAAGYTVTTLARPSGPAAPAATAPARPLRLTATGVIDPGSNRYWAQSDLALTTPAPLTALTVELRIAQTGGVADTGNWRTLPAEDFTVSVRAEREHLVYRWTLRPGRTAPAGRHVFAAQYNHAEGPRDSGADTYKVTATAADARQGGAYGGFAPHTEGPPR